MLTPCSYNTFIVILVTTLSSANVLPPKSFGEWQNKLKDWKFYIVTIKKIKKKGVSDGAGSDNKDPDSREKNNNKRKQKC